MFRSAQEALSFAYRTSGQPIVKTSSIGKMQSDMMRGARGGSEMTVHDRHAQAAMILGVVERSVDVIGQAYFMAHYGKGLTGETQKPLAEILVRAVVAGLPTGVHQRRGIEALIRVYFGQKIGIAAQREALRCPHRKYAEIKNAVHGVLDAIGSRADAAAHRALDAAGVIVIEVAA